MKKLMTVIAISAVALCAAEAGSRADKDAAVLKRDLPPNYGKIALAAVKARLKDPDSVKVLRLSAKPPEPSRGSRPGTVVWVECNAKNSFGGYTGVQPILVLFHNGVIEDIVD